MKGPAVYLLIIDLIHSNRVSHIQRSFIGNEGFSKTCPHITMDMESSTYVDGCYCKTMII